MSGEGMHWPYCIDGQCAGCLPELVTPVPHEHRPVKGPLGVIVCETCEDLQVLRPAGMPDYRRAAMRRW